MYDTPDTQQNNRTQQFDVGTQVAARPLLALGAAMAAGYILGRIDAQKYEGAAQRASWEDSTSSRADRGALQNTDDLFAPVRDEIEQIRSAAMAVAKQKLHDLMHGHWDQLMQHGNAPQAARGVVDPNAGRDYLKTYHPPSEQQGM